MSATPRSRAAGNASASSRGAPFLARHLAALALAVLGVDALAAYGSRYLAWSVVPGWHTWVVAPSAVPWFLGVAAVLGVVHALLAVALWQRLRHGKTHRSGY